MSGICSGRVVIVTGAGGGLGAAHARTLAAEGAAVLVNDINLETRFVNLLDRFSPLCAIPSFVLYRNLAMIDRPGCKAAGFLLDTRNFLQGSVWHLLYYSNP